MEQDFLDKANIKVVKGNVANIDYEKKTIKVRGLAKPIDYDKCLFAVGSSKKRLAKEYSNVHYLEDRHAHAKCHNAIIKAKSIMVLGHTFEAYQIAASTRIYLDSLGFRDIEISILCDSENSSEVLQNFGEDVTKAIHNMMKE